MEKPFPALPTGNRSAVMAKQANRVTKTRGIPRAVIRSVATAVQVMMMALMTAPV